MENSHHRITNKITLAILSLLLIAATPRSESVRREFKKLNPCPSTRLPKGPCPGYVIDHIVPLACNGADAIQNLQWQSVEEAKAKDKWERRQCRP